MKFTNEQLTKAKQTKSVEELIALAKENGMELTEEEAAKYFAELYKEGELADEELDNVAGGCGGDDDGKPKQKFKVGDRIELIEHADAFTMPEYHGTVTECFFVESWKGGMWWYKILYDTGNTYSEPEDAIKKYVI